MASLIKRSVYHTCALSALLWGHSLSAQTQSAAGAPATVPAGEQTPVAAPANGQRIEEIIVTAQKRSENLQNVPISISAVTGASLSKTGITSLVSIRAAVPSLNLTDTNGRLTLSLRGIGTTAIGAGIENPVALYMDGVYIGAPAASLLSLNQIERIEVLKGPQGTLFGRNATGGLVQIITKDPTDKTVISGNLTYGNYRDVTGNFYVAGKVADGVNADLALYGRHRGTGWGKNLFDGSDLYGIDHDIAVRSKWILSPWQGGRITLIGDYSDTRDTMLPLPALPGSISPFEPGVQPDRGYDAVLNDFRDHRVRGGGVSGRLVQDLGGVALTSITAYRKSRTVIGGDLDASAQHIEYYDSTQHDKQFSQELQLSSKGTGRLKYTLGAFFYSARSDTPAVIGIGDAGIVISLGREALKTKSSAAYGQVTYEIFDATNLTLGGRYTHETRKTQNAEIKVSPFGQPPENFPFFPVPDASLTSSKFTYRVSLDHRFSDGVLGYVSVNRGFRSGGFNVVSPGSAAFLPETLDAYEAGLKTDLFDRRVRLNVAGFYYTYKNIQTLRLVTAGVQTINGGKAKDYGVDADLTAILAPGLRLTAGATLLSAKFGTFLGCPTSAPLGGVPVFAGDCTGHQLTLASKFTANLGMDYNVRMDSGALIDLNANAYSNSGYYTTVDNVIRQKRFLQLGASARYTAPGGHYYVGVFGKNLTNRRVIAFGATQTGGLQQVTYAEPRTYGINLGFNF